MFRNIVGRLALGTTLLAAGLAMPAMALADDPKPPNVVLIIADDMAWNDYGFMGHPQIKTPHLDRLASESLVFPRGYVTTSLCSPSLASILTGRWPHQHGITSNDPPIPPGLNAGSARRDPKFLAARQEMIKKFDAMESLPRLLAKKDYLSFEAGKWWGGSYKRGGFTHGMTHGEPNRGGRHGDAGLAIGRQGMRPVNLFIEMAAARKAPFFLWYAPMMPHQPHNPPERLVAHYRDKAPSESFAKYWAMCEWFDETVGELLAFLESEKLAENTIVIYLADNGWIQDPKADRYAPRSKQSPYEGGLRTPVMLRWPGHTEHQTSEIPVSAIDLAPTILKAVGIAPPKDLEGVDLLDKQAVAEHGPVFGELFTHNAVNLDDPAASLRFQWIIDGDWKLVVPDPVNEPKAPVELFDVKHDPNETHDVAAEHRDKVAELMPKVRAHWMGARRPNP